MLVTVLMIPVVILILAIPVMIGTYVYRDANRRGMNAALWTLVVILAPVLVGFIIYLLVRGNYSDLKCPKCGTTVREEYVRCPKCGAKLRPYCPNCQAPVERDWVVCPRCAQPLPEIQTDIVRPVKKEDRTLGKILIAVILIPVLLVIAGIFLFSVAGTASVGSAGLTTMPTEEYLQEIKDAGLPSASIEKWLDSCGEDQDKAYVLRNIQKGETEEETIVQYLIYMPRMSRLPSVSVWPNEGWFGEKLRLAVHADRGETGDTVAIATTRGRGNTKLEIDFGENERIDCEITDVAYKLYGE